MYIANQKSPVYSSKNRSKTVHNCSLIFQSLQVIHVSIIRPSLFIFRIHNLPKRCIGHFLFIILRTPVIIHLKQIFWFYSFPIHSSSYSVHQVIIILFHIIQKPDRGRQSIISSLRSVIGILVKVTLRMSLSFKNEIKWFPVCWFNDSPSRLK